MARVATFRFTVKETREVTERVRRHLGARRFAYNRCLQAVKEGLEARQRDPDHRVPWSGFDLINWWNDWKHREDAGRCFAVDTRGKAELVAKGLSWQGAVCAQVFEEAAVDLGRALRAFSDSTRGRRSARPVGFPRFQKKNRNTESFRLRNKRSASGRSSIRLGEGGPRVLHLPVVGKLSVREDTRRLRRVLRPGPTGTPRGRICSVTVARRQGRLVVHLTCEVADFHPARRHREGPRRMVGLDRGIRALVVAADAHGNEWARVRAPKPLARSLVALQRASRVASRAMPGSKNRERALRRLGTLHARIARQRLDCTHRTSSELVKTHGALCLEDLALTNLVRNRRLARSLHDVALGELGRQLAYKAPWYGTHLVIAPRSFPSTKRCSRCGWRWEDMGLSDRVFVCRRCGFSLDRDANAAANLAAWGEAHSSWASQAPDPEARGRVDNACRGGSAGRRRSGGATASATPSDGKTQEPGIPVAAG